MEHLGIVGLAGSGHAQLFGALTGLDASSAADRLVGVVSVSDDRLDRLADMSASRKVVPATFEVVFLPGLAAEPGKGLGSRLLGSLRDCDAMCLVASGASGADPAGDFDDLEAELLLADMGSVEQRLAKQRRAAKGDKALGPEVAALERADAILGEGVPLHRSDLVDSERLLLAPAFLLTIKPVLRVVNVGVEQIDEGAAVAAALGDGTLALCGEIEGDPDVVATVGSERAALLADLGVAESVVPRLARAAYLLLGRRTFFTTGDKESRAWTFRAGARAPECAGVIHSDLQRGFIRAEVIHWDLLLELGSWARAKESGKLRVEGKEYEVADGDVLEIRFNV